MIDHLSDSQEVVLIPIDWDGIDESRLARWTLPTNGIEVLGTWEGSLVLHQAGQTWTLAPGPGPTAGAGIGTATEPVPVLVAEGTVLAYDGRYLTRLACPTPGACEIAVGPLDEPDRHVVPVPEMLAPLDHEAWTSSVAISSDGARMAVSARFGALSLPVVIDLDTGVAISRSDGMNHRAPGGLVARRAVAGLRLHRRCHGLELRPGSLVADLGQPSDRAPGLARRRHRGRARHRIHPRRRRQR